jgi:WD40 repeat protein/DNA-binding SARP family transcriptional activator
VIGLIVREHHDTRRRMQIRVLGHLEASVDDRPVALGGAKQRAVLAMLGLEANRTVTSDRLIEGLWGEEPPRSAAKMVQNYVWRLRRVLAGDGGAEILTHGRGYELRIDRELVDVCRFERLVSEAARSAAAGEPGGAAREALALFRGDPLTDVADEPFASAEIRRLEELRLRAAELAIDADLSAGRHQEVAGEIDALLAENPLRERLHAQRMLALYRCGRQAEALEAYRHARGTLVEEIGIEPTPELRRLHDAILRQDPSLDVEPAVAELPRELDAAAAPPLIGRAGELRRMRARWQRAAAGGGALMTLVGAYGMGKTRMAAEIAADAHREEAAVLYAAGTGPPEAAIAAMARTRDARRPMLLVLDDADRAPSDVRSALRELAHALVSLPVLVLATGQEAAALARLEPHDSITLDPLDADAVRTIAGFYAPAGGGDAVPVETLLATSRGVARRVHEAASEWARREATRRVDVVADRAAAGRSEARALEVELAGSVVELQSARERAGLVARGSEDADGPVVCPYKGLATFDSEDAEYFFGRERLVAELVARLVGAPLLAVVGPSGSGKSSVLRAGLLPALAGGVLPGSDDWAQALIRPGEHPMRELRRTTRRLAREWRSVLAVDQFEELFTACQDEEERAEFVAALVRAARDRSGDCVVVLAVRADFYGRCAAYPELSRLLGANHVLVGPMSRDELQRAIERPAQRVGLSVEPELVDALLTDVEGQPGALPLLSTALLELWRQRDRRRLRLAAYARSGGVQGAVARLAEDAFVRLDPLQQAVARTLLLRLADEEESGAIVRRRIGLAELEAEGDTEVAGVVAGLTDRRLLTVSDGAVEVAHEALLREWPRLRAWLDEDVQGRRLHRQLSDAARAWDADARDPDGLYRGARLASALDWAAEHEPELNATERAFLDDSRSASGRAQRRLRVVLAGVAALLVLAVIAGAVALDQRGNARAGATAADAQRLGAQALVADDLDRGLLLARQGVALNDSVQTRGNLLAALLKSPAAIGVLRGDGDRLRSLDLSPDERTLAVIDNDGTLSFVDTRTRRPAARPQTVSGLTALPEGVASDALRFSSDASLLAVGGDQPVVMDARTHRVLVRLRNTENQVIYRLRFSPDGRTLFTAVTNDPEGSTTIERFDARSGRPLGAERYVNRRLAPVTLLVTRDGRRLVTSFEDGPTVIRDARTLRPLKHLPDGADQAALSRDDRTLLLGGRDGSVRFLDLVTRKVRTASGRHGGAVVRATFSADGRTAVTAGDDDRVIVWNVERAAAGETLQGHAGRITGMAISRDSQTLYTAALDGKVLVWDLAGAHRLGRPFEIGRGTQRDPLVPPTRALPSHAVSPDGRDLAVGQRDGTVSLIDARTLQPRSSFRAVPKGPVQSLAYVPGGRLLVVGGDDGFLALVDPRRGALVKSLPGHRGTLLTTSFSADGRLMASASTPPGDTVLLWALPSGRRVGSPLLKSPVLDQVGDVSLSPDGRTLAVTHPGLGIEIVDVATRRHRASLPQTKTVVFVVRFTPDGRFLVGGSYKGWARLWSTKTWRPVSRVLAGHTGEVLWQSTSADSRTLATGGTDGTIRLFDLRTQRALGAPLPGVPNRPVAPQFTPDGAHLFAITDAGRAYRWDVRPSSWARHACAVAGRTLTRAEWSDALPERDYAPACTR